MEECRYKEINYIVKYPKTYEINKKNPVIIFFAGAGSRGNNLDVIRHNPFFVETQAIKTEAIIYAPQCHADTWFEIFEQIIDFIDFVRKNPSVDKSRIYLMGASMGGYAVWQLAMTRPEWFAAIVPICGGGMYWNAARLKNVKVWAFHGTDDSLVYCEESKKMVESINQNGGVAKLTIYENVGHDSWLNVYKDQKVFDWLMKQELAEYTEESSRYDDAKRYG